MLEHLSIYELMHLPAHLATAQQGPYLHRLLALSASSGSNAWFEAKERAANDTDSYAEDLRLAWRVAEASASESVPLELTAHYALMIATLNTAASQIPARLIVALVDGGLWSIKRALVAVRRIPDPWRRARLLIELAKREQGDARIDFAMDALQSIAKISDYEARSTQLVACASLLDEKGLLEATRIADKIEDDFFRSQALRALSHRRAELRRRTSSESVDMELAALDDPQERAWLAIALLSSAPPDGLSKILVLIGQIADESMRTQALLLAAAAVNDAARARLLDIAAGIKECSARARAYSGLIGLGLPAEVMVPAVVDAIASIQSFISKQHNALNLSAMNECIAQILEQRRRPANRDVIALTLDFVRRIHDHDDARGLLVSAAWWMDGVARDSTLAQALSRDLRDPRPTIEEAAKEAIEEFSALRLPDVAQAIAGIPAQVANAHAILGVVPRLAELGHEALALSMFESAASPRHQVPLLEHFVRHLSESGIGRIRLLLNSIPEIELRGEAACFVATRLAKVDAASLLLETLHACQRVNDGACLELCAASVLRELGRAGDVDIVLAHAPTLSDERSRLDLMLSLTARPMSSAQLDAFIATLSSFRDKNLALEGYCASIGLLEGARRGDLLQSTAELAREVSGWESPGPVFFKFVPVLLDTAEFEFAMELCRKIGAKLGGYTDRDIHGRTLFPSSDARTRLCWLLARRGQRSHAARLAEEIDNPNDRFDALMSIVESGRRRRSRAPAAALEAANRIADGWMRMRAMARLAPYLTSRELPALALKARSAQRSITDMNQRRASSELMVAIAGGSGATERALEEARRISDSTYRARALAKLAEHVPARSLAALFEAAQGLPPTDRAEALEPLLERLTGARLENAATAVLAVDDDDLPIRARRVARAGLPKLAISAALAIRKDRERRFRALEMLADFLNRSELTEVFAEAASEAPHGYREYLYLNSNITWKLVVKLAPLVAQLPPEISAMCWRRTLRDWSFSERGDLANMLGALMPIQAALRGKPSSRAMLDSLAQVRRWWQ